MVVFHRAGISALRMLGPARLGGGHRLASSLHPRLRERAAALRTELQQLTDSQDYGPETAVRMARLTPTVEQFGDYERAENELRELQDLLNDASLAEDARIEIKLAEETRDRLEASLKLRLVPPHPFADKACLLEIRPGVGGSEAALFAQDLLTMYQAYALQKGWPTQVVAKSPTPNGGLIEAILHIKEPGAYDRLQYEGGIHRVQRVPETETKGRVHTSTAAVVVLPDMGADEDVEKSFAPGELRIDVMRASGSGGQHVNTTESAVRIVHIPTGMVATCQDERSQHKNKARALLVLRARLAERERAAQQAAGRAARKAQVTTADRSDKIRTYNFPQNRLTDHRCGFSEHHLSEIMAGDLDNLVDACGAWAQGEAVAQIAAQ